MWNIIKKYYLLTFLSVFMLTGIKIFTTESTFSFMKNMLITFVTAFVCSLFAGVLFYFYDTKWGPKKRNKMFAKKPFSELFMNGFMQKEHAAVGVINSYTVVINYTWPNGVSAIAVNVLFDKDLATHYKGNIADIKKRNRSYSWNEGAIGRLLTYNFSPPSYNKIMETAETLIVVLKAEGLPATNYNDKEEPKLATGNVTSFHATAV